MRNLSAINESEDLVTKGWVDGLFAQADLELGVTNNAVASIAQRIADVEQWKASPVASEAYIRDLSAGSINLGGVDIWSEAGSTSDAPGMVKIGGILAPLEHIALQGGKGITIEQSSQYGGSVLDIISTTLEGVLTLGNTTKSTYVKGSTLNIGDSSHGTTVLGNTLTLGATSTATALKGSAITVTGDTKFANKVAINTDVNNSYYLYVNGASRFNGTVYLGSANYYLGNDTATSHLYSLSVGSITALSVSNDGVVGVANTNGFSGTASTGALKVSGGAYIAGNLGVFGKKIYFDSKHYIELDSNGYLHTNVGFYSDSFVASGGVGDAGGSGGGSYNIVDWAAIQAGTATGVASENNDYLPTAYALRQTYVAHNNLSGTVNTLSGTVSNLRSGSTDFTDILIRKTTNNPTISFEGEYDGGTGSNITLGTLAGYKATISSTAYKGLKFDNDIFLTNGKHFYIFDYNGNPRSAIYYPSANYNELRLGDSNAATDIMGSTVYVNGTAIGSAAYRTYTATFSETGSTLPTCNAINTFLNDQVRSMNNAVAQLRASVSDLLSWKVKPVASEMTVGDIGITSGINLSGVDIWYNGTQVQIGGNFKAAGVISNQYGLSVNTTTVPNSSYALRVSGNATISGTLSVENYGVRGKKIYNLTTLFGLSEGDTISTIDSSSVESFISDIGNGRSELYVAGSVTLNGVAYSPRYDVQVGSTSGQNISLYYVKLGTTPPLTFEILQIGYASSSWKVLTRISKTIS